MQSVLRALMNRCPQCGEDALFVGVYRTHDVCPSCGVRHERLDGTWVAAAGISSGLALTLACLLTVQWYVQTGETVAAWIPLVGAAGVMGVGYRITKAALFGLLHRVGMVHEDPAQVGNVLFLETIREKRRRSALKPGSQTSALEKER
ncbi:MAG: hypothetical protein GY913_09580 [Proteobacteria bacterium]|nr:hypothetical protein [Pseudomonadota bacterium]